MEARGSFFIIATAAGDTLIYDRLEEAVDWARHHDRNGTELFIGVNPRAREARDKSAVEAVTACFVDLSDAVSDSNVTGSRAEAIMGGGLDDLKSGLYDPNGVLDRAGAGERKESPMDHLVEISVPTIDESDETAPSMAELWAIVQEQRAEVDALKTELGSQRRSQGRRAGAENGVQDERVSRGRLFKVVAAGAAGIASAAVLKPQDALADTGSAPTYVATRPGPNINGNSAGFEAPQSANFDTGVSALANSTGVYGVGQSLGSTGVIGEGNTGVSGIAIVLSGSSDELGAGVHGTGTTGVWGEGRRVSVSSRGIGVYGTTADGSGPGVRGDGVPGVLGNSGTAAGVTGLTGTAATPSPAPIVGVYGSGSSGSTSTPTNRVGVWGDSDTFDGVHGGSITGTGVRGVSSSGRGAAFQGGEASVRLVPSTATKHPPSGLAGDLFVDAGHRLWYCVGGSAWKQLA